MKFVLHVLAAVCLMAAGWGLARWMAKPVITIEEVVVTETKYIRAAETEQELKNCYESSIVITAEMLEALITYYLESEYEFIADIIERATGLKIEEVLECTE